MNGKLTYLLFLAIVLKCATSSAQADTKLLAYLKLHAADFNKPAELNILQDKQLFVFGECNHNLPYNSAIRKNLVKNLPHSFHKELQYYIYEMGRSDAYLFNYYMKTTNTPLLDSPFNAMLANSKRRLSALMDSARFLPAFTFMGIDFERPKSLFLSLNLLLKDVQQIPALSVWNENFKQTYTDYTFDREKHVNHFSKKYNRFVTHDYGQMKKAFKNHEREIAAMTAPDAFQELQYIFSNTQEVPDNKNRNPGMARNLIQIRNENMDTNKFTILNMGMAHTVMAWTKNTTRIASQSPELKNKMVIMNAHCDNCSVNGLQIPNYYKFLRQPEILASFKEVAQSIGDEVLFDLSELPEEYQFIKKYGDLLLFLSNKH